MVPSPPVDQITTEGNVANRTPAASSPVVPDRSRARRITSSSRTDAVAISKTRVAITTGRRSHSISAAIRIQPNCV
ncbi:MAG: hypothetical protein R3F34_01575 [Planctomycetota bacterium]